MRLRFAAAAFVAGALAAAPAPAQVPAELAAAIRAGQVGERYDGYLGHAAATSLVAQRQAGAINIRRRSLYTDLARRRGVLPQDAGLATGCELLARVQVGEAYMLSDGQWRRRAAGQSAPVPDYCR